MHLLTSVEMVPYRELEYELREFFNRLHHIKRVVSQKGQSLSMNRLQRIRCMDNIHSIERLERDFYEISHRGDILHLYRELQQFVRLDSVTLMERFAKNRIEKRSLFIAL